MQAIDPRLAKSACRRSRGGVLIRVGLIHLGLGQGLGDVGETMDASRVEDYVRMLANGESV